MVWMKQGWWWYQRCGFHGGSQLVGGERSYHGNQLSACRHGDSVLCRREFSLRILTHSDSFGIWWVKVVKKCTTFFCCTLTLFHCCFPPHSILFAGKKFGVNKLGTHVINFISQATQQRLRVLLEKASHVAQQKNTSFKVAMNYSNSSRIFQVALKKI